MFFLMQQIVIASILFVSSAETLLEYRDRRTKEHLHHVKSVNDKVLYAKPATNLRMKPLSVTNQGYLLIESFGSDNECNPTNSDKLTGIAAGQCINFGTAKGSFIYQYNYIANTEGGAGAIQLYGNFYRDDNCVDFSYREDNLSTHNLNECSKDSLVDKYYKYSYTHDPTSSVPYLTGFQAR